MVIMRKLAFLAFTGVVASAATVARCNSDSGAQQRAQMPRTAATASAKDPDATPAYAPQILKQKSGVDKATEDRVYDDAAHTAWAFIEHNYSAQTGFVNANPTWPYPTLWDVASSIASYYSARGLGIITDQDYKTRTRKALETLKAARLYNGIAYGSNYDANTGELVGLDQKPSQTGTRYSSLDLGRLLIWLKIVAEHDADLAPLANDVAHRLNGKKIIKGGYLQGEQITKDGKTSYQEGRLGYEQYAASGFNLWGMRADRALNMRSNARTVQVDGVPVWVDKRGLDRLTSEPFIIHGVELGLSGDMRELAWQTLALQAKRYEKTGQMTMASEDALNDKPYYFYYYCVYCSGKEFVINVHKPGVNLDAPRWISSKAAFAWNVLLPSQYTWLAIKSVQHAQQPGRGWTTGVYEKTNKSTGAMSLNTDAVILESALYHKTGKPLITM